ncbi:MAG: sugar phosphate isomerase/epimerase, partial [Clostridiales bacterium]|nr:sugar phosphate isomerase/epimerase [Clostridiales bacterium]
MKYVKVDLGADMEFIPDQMLPGSPYPSEETLKEWDRLINKYQIVPVCCGSYVNDKLYKNRLLTEKEGADKLIQEIKLANRLGFHMVKVVSTTRTGIVERALDAAEKYDVVITSEIHGGMSFNMPYVQDYVDLINRVKSPYLGLTVDTGIFCRRHPRRSTEYFQSLGLNNDYLVSYIDDIFARGDDPNAYFMAHPEKMDEMMGKCNNELERMYLVFSTGYDNNPVSILDEHMPYVKHIHA